MKTRLITFCTLAACSVAAQAQTSITLYGNLDQYMGHIRCDTGQKVTALYDGAILRSRLGFRGSEALGGGYQASFLLEGDSMPTMALQRMAPDCSTGRHGLA